MSGPRVLLIDNDDSYTYNLYHLIGELTGRPPHVVDHDQRVDPRRYSHLVISPGPGHPADPRRVGRLAELIMDTDRPVLGVCLGHQLLGLLFGASVIKVRPHHGLISRIRHDGRGVLAGLPQDFRAVRYHSLAVVDPPAELELTARARDDDVIMGLRHRSRDLHGVQFHPESVAAEHGRDLMINFLGLPCPEPVEGPSQVASPRPPSTGSGRRFDKLRERTRIEYRELPWRDPEDVFVAHYAGRGPVCWLDAARVGPRSRFSYLGAPDEVLTGRYDDPSTEDVLTELADRLNRSQGESAAPFPFQGGYVGYLGYPEPGRGGEAEFGRLDRFFVFDHAERRCYAAAVGAPAWLDRAESMILSTGPAGEPRRDGRLGVLNEPDQEWYRSAYRRVQEYLHSGDSYEVNLTFQRRLAYRGDRAELYRHLRRLNPAPHAAYLELPSATVLSSSPERFLEIDDRGRVQARPIKGTAPRDADPLRDAAAAERLRTETKTRAENLMIADLLRHDLGLSCRLGSVRVPELMLVESHPSVHQLVSTVEGDLEPGLDAVDCVRAALPPGSMTGAPKHRTCEIIDEVERGPRGIYSGVLGYFSYSGTADLSVIIRTLVSRDAEELSVGVGGGVITLSDPDDEYAEALLKSEALIAAVRQSCREPIPVGHNVP
ncbi:chorismate-binding protein [Microlunatus parietis]|uniref:aminodeoxychorismate synthase n=1 Tax=Microlunatus parietis TaxID=682979 RepID=A0A7Y9IAE3_9ACTN|nr:chorismate-binding protein [Microlunatus parietis]NYE73224.1 para-aminobenzoate synthetase [Microlunatus parietis]